VPSRHGQGLGFPAAPHLDGLGVGAVLLLDRDHQAERPRIGGRLDGGHQMAPGRAPLGGLDRGAAFGQMAFRMLGIGADQGFQTGGTGRSRLSGPQRCHHVQVIQRRSMRPQRRQNGFRLPPFAGRHRQAQGQKRRRPPRRVGDHGLSGQGQRPVRIGSRFGVGLGGQNQGAPAQGGRNIALGQGQGLVPGAGPDLFGQSRLVQGRGRFRRCGQRGLNLGLGLGLGRGGRTLGRGRDRRPGRFGERPGRHMPAPAEQPRQHAPGRRRR